MIALNMENGKEVVMNWIAIAVEFVRALLLKVVHAFNYVVFSKTFTIVLLALIQSFLFAIESLAVLHIAMIFMTWAGVLSSTIAVSIALSTLSTFVMPLALFLLPFLLVFHLLSLKGES